jgi:hypothetical protein
MKGCPAFVVFLIRPSASSISACDFLFFFSNPELNRNKRQRIEISQLLVLYAGDTGTSGTLQGYVHQVAVI